MAVPANWLIPARVRQATSWLPRRTLRAERRRSHLSQSLDMPATADRAAMTRKVAPHASATTMVQIRTGTPNHQPGKDPRVYVWPSSRTRESVRGDLAGHRRAVGGCRHVERLGQVAPTALRPQGSAREPAGRLPDPCRDEPVRRHGHTHTRPRRHARLLCDLGEPWLRRGRDL